MNNCLTPSGHGCWLVSGLQGIIFWKIRLKSEFPTEPTLSAFEHEQEWNLGQKDTEAEKYPSSTQAAQNAVLPTAWAEWKAADEISRWIRDKYTNGLRSLGTRTSALESCGKDVENEATQGRENASQPHGQGWTNLLESMKQTGRGGENMVTTKPSRNQQLQHMLTAEAGKYHGPKNVMFGLARARGGREVSRGQSRSQTGGSWGCGSPGSPKGARMEHCHACCRHHLRCHLCSTRPGSRPWVPSARGGRGAALWG